MQTKTINVTRKVIRAGQPNSSKKCPIALTLKKHFINAVVQVGDEFSWILDKQTGDFSGWKHPEKLVEGIHYFDILGKRMHAGKYRLEKVSGLKNFKRLKIAVRSGQGLSALRRALKREYRSNEPKIGKNQVSLNVFGATLIYKFSKSANQFLRNGIAAPCKVTFNYSRCVDAK